MQTRGTVINDVFSALLYGLPQEMLLAVIWIAYSVWLALTMRRFVPVWSPRRFSTFASMSRFTIHTAQGADAPKPTAEQN